MEKDKIKETGHKIAALDEEIKQLQKKKAEKIAALKKAAQEDTAYNKEYEGKLTALKARYAKEIAQDISEATMRRNEILAKEIYLSIGRYKARKRNISFNRLLSALRQAMINGVNLDDDEERNNVFKQVTFRVRYLDETERQLHGTCVIDLANIKDPHDWSQIRGSQDRHHLPGSHDLPEPHHHHWQADHFRNPQASELLRGGGPGPGAWS